MKKTIIISVWLFLASSTIHCQETKFNTSIQNAIGFGFSDKPTWVLSANNNYTLNEKWSIDFDFTTSSHTELRSVMSQEMQIPIDYVYANTYQIFGFGMSNEVLTKAKTKGFINFGISYAYRNHSKLLETSNFLDDFNWAPNKYHYFGLQTGIAIQWNVTNRFFIELRCTVFYYPLENKIMNSNGVSFGIKI